MGRIFSLEELYPIWGIYVFLIKNTDCYEVAYIGINIPRPSSNDETLSHSIFGRLDKHVTGGKGETSDVFKQIKEENKYKFKTLRDILKNISLIVWLPSASDLPGEDEKSIKKFLKRLENYLIEQLNPKYNKQSQKEENKPQTFLSLQEAEHRIKELIEEFIL